MRSVPNAVTPTIAGPPEVICVARAESPPGAFHRSDETVVSTAHHGRTVRRQIQPGQTVIRQVVGQPLRLSGRIGNLPKLALRAAAVLSHGNQQRISVRQPMRAPQIAVGSEERAHRSGRHGEFVQLAAHRRHQRRKDYGLAVWRPSGSQKTVDGYVRAHRGQKFFARAVRIGRQQFEGSLIWNAPYECELLAIGREADGSVYIAHDLLRIAAQHGHFVERAEELIFLGGFSEINVIAVGEKVRP